MPVDKGSKSTIERADTQAGGSTISFDSLKEGRLLTSLHPPYSRASRSEKLGELLVERGVLKPEQTTQVLAHQERTGFSFGDSVRLMGLATEAQLKQALAEQFGYPCLPVGDKTLNSELVAAYYPDGSYAENLRQLRSELLASMTSKCLVVAVLSPKHGEGRTHLVGNLAIVFAQLGRRVLVVDADLRRSRVHMLFKVDNECGASMLLAGRKCEKPVQAVAHFPGLDILTAGPKPPNPQELILGEGMLTLVRSAKERYDAVLIDTPPAALFADAEILAQAADTCVIVARKHKTQQRRLNELASRLKKKNIELAGCVLVS